MGLGAECDARELRFHYADPEHRLAGVRLQQRSGIERVDFAYSGGGWSLVTTRPEVWRVEYLLELAHPDGTVETVTDPNNPAQVDGAFGPKSVLACPGYAPPAWLAAPAAEGRRRELTVPAPSLGAAVAVGLWSPMGPTATAEPTDHVLVAHDGPEFDRLAALGRFAATHQDPKFHLVLVEPGRGARDEWYSANPAYAEALVDAVLPAVARELGTAGPVVGLGASLGAVAMLHAQRRSPGSFAGLFLQSGSFFLPRTDQSERTYRWFGRITRFVADACRRPAPPVPTAMTCGLIEENLVNNRRMARALHAQGYGAPLAEVPDGHNFTAWRDAFDPHLTRLLRQVWGGNA
jgi:enterochelin esterase family protein